MKLWALLVLALVWTGSAQASPFVTLRWTNPAFNAALDDSGNPYCDVGPDSLKDLAAIEIWGQSSDGGPARKVYEQGAIGHEAQPDSAIVDLQSTWATWHFWIISRDMSSNRSCASNSILIRGSQVTGVPIGPVDEVLRTAYFDVRGRLVKKPQTSGIYWFRTWYKSGRVETKRVVVLH